MARVIPRRLATAALLALAVSPGPAIVGAQPPSSLAPSFSEVEQAWTAVWERLRQGDLAGARRYVHSSRRALFPGGRTVTELQDVARQMAACRLVPSPVLLGFEELMYPVRCEQAGETAETYVGVRRDVDGVWRFVTL